MRFLVISGFLFWAAVGYGDHEDPKQLVRSISQEMDAMATVAEKIPGFYKRHWQKSAMKQVSMLEKSTKRLQREIETMPTSLGEESLELALKETQYNLIWVKRTYLDLFASNSRELVNPNLAKTHAKYTMMRESVSKIETLLKVLDESLSN